MDKVQQILTDLYDHASQHGLMAARRYEELKTTAITNATEQIRQQERERVEKAISNIKAAKRVSSRGKQTADLLNVREILDAALRELKAKQ